MMKQRLVIDMDDVMAATAKKLLKIYNDEFDTSLTPQDFLGKSFSEVVLAENYAKIHHNVYEKGFFIDIEVMPDAIEVVRALHQKYEVFVVSAATEFPNSLSEKIIWLNEHFSFISWKNTVFCGDKSIVSADFMIDDHEKNLRTFKGKTLLFDAIHNQKYAEFNRFMNWKEIENYLM